MWNISIFMVQKTSIYIYKYIHTYLTFKSNMKLKRCSPKFWGFWSTYF